MENEFETESFEASLRNNFYPKSEQTFTFVITLQ